MIKNRLNTEVRRCRPGVWLTIPATCLLFVCHFPWAFGDTNPGDGVSGLDVILARMAEARSKNLARFRPYTVTRGYSLFGKQRDKAKSHVIADVNFIPPDLKNYTIEKSQGTGIGTRVVRRMLAGEAKIAKDLSLTELSPRNYEFRFSREEDLNGEHCYVLEMIPRRKDGSLIRGECWIDAKTYLPRRIEGEPAKTPSWLVSNLHVSLIYKDVQGMWLQTGLEATAQVRLLGQYTVVSQDLSYRIDERLTESARSQSEFAATGR